MPDITWTHPGLPLILDQIPINARSIIDIGCGRGIVGALCRIYREPTRLVGVDVYEPYLEFCRSLRLYDEVVRLDLANQPLPFADKEFDVATCVEVIEHLPTPAGERLLDELERIAHRVIVTTPNGFFEQPDFDHNPHQEHLSGWDVRKFRARHYAVIGVGPAKVRGRRLKYVSAALAPLGKVLPGLSSMLVAVRDP